MVARATEALRSVYNVEQPEGVGGGGGGGGGGGPRSMFDECDLSGVRMRNATAECHLDEVVGLNYFGAV